MSFSYVGGDVTAGRAAGVTAGRGDLTETEEGETAAGRGGDPTRGNEDSQDVSESPFANTSPKSRFSSSTGSGGDGERALDAGGLINGEATSADEAVDTAPAFFCCRFLSMAFARAALAALSSSDIVRSNS